MRKDLIAETEQYACYRIPVMRISTNCYVVVDKGSQEAAIIDPGGDGQDLIETLTEMKAKPVLIINTHGHWDHIGGNKALQQHYGLEIAIHEVDAPMLGDRNLNVARYFDGDGDGGKANRLLKDGDIIKMGSLEFKVLHTPGHTQGGICLILDKLLFSGDTLFNLSIGRTDLAGGDFDAISESLARLKTLDDELIVLPGHGPDSKLGFEKTHNPYLRG